MDMSSILSTYAETTILVFDYGFGFTIQKKLRPVSAFWNDRLSKIPKQSNLVLLSLDLVWEQNDTEFSFKVISCSLWHILIVWPGISTEHHDAERSLEILMSTDHPNKKSNDNTS